MEAHEPVPERPVRPSLRMAALRADVVKLGDDEIREAIRLLNEILVRRLANRATGRQET